ncbi:MULTISPECIES: EscU/YscU/HrcU family type III secretion system export apparatus switch protein [unclassified Arsukibacterium]|uniref:EscU/YscU/HrcU family type III secretion system export apparatus switch protein n=1 Tax=unclassified Arsukibacterium TaxID=2635278 RepID=UPI000C8B82E7|nr:MULTISPECIES: EscU/YscU/HrcU family type III secretion system export apparatus switch protein [unclassified Arsukibacterium]MAA95399.1 flagellar biosynthesis protein FlhB [Rheinheimera sp.]HAW93099.1 flagellar biosynthesis protein FlhB [Candidatus Azambacteria bacterium]
MANDDKQTNTRQRSATALKYDGKAAPTIVAKGHGELAEDIIALAKEHGVLIHQDDELNRLLSQLQLGDNIPKELYVVIAELIAFSYVLQGKFPEQWQNIHQRIDLKT